MAKIQFEQANYGVRQHDAIYEVVGVNNDMFEMRLLGTAKADENVVLASKDIILATLGTSETPLPFAEVGENMYVLIDNDNDHDLIICTYVEELYHGSDEQDEQPAEETKPADEPQEQLPEEMPVHYTCAPHASYRQQEKCWLRDETMMYLVALVIGLAACKCIRLVIGKQG